MAVAEAVAGIDDHQRVVDFDARALKAVIHDEEIAAVLVQKQPRARRAISRHGHRCVRGKQKRLVADMPGAVVARIHHMRLAERAAVPPRQEAGLVAHLPCAPGKRDRHRGLAGAADGEIADAKHGAAISSRAARFIR